MLIPGDATAVALGRQALGLVARALRDVGCRTVLVPAFSCQTMVTPWELEGMAVIRVPVGPDLLMSAPALSGRLEGCLAHGGAPVVLHCETFGITAGAGLAQVLEEASGQVPVIVDRTHSFLADQLAPGAGRRWIEVVSTRKLLPVPEVSWVAGVGRCAGPGQCAGMNPSGIDRPGPRGTADDRLTRARERYLRSPGLETFEAVEDLADEAWAPVPPHRCAVERLAAFDARGFAVRMLATRRLLASRVSGLDVVNPSAVCPMVIRTPKADAMADELHRRGLDGPIHWDRPEHLDADWPDDLLCLPMIMSEPQIGITADVLDGPR